MFRRAAHKLGQLTGRLNARFAGPIVNTSSGKGVTGLTRQSLSNAAKETEEKYAQSLSIMHWLIAGGFVGCVFTVNAKNYTDDKAMKGKLMNIHKSFGVLMMGLAVPRLALRLSTKIPAKLPGMQWEHIVGSASHIALYGAIIFMPLSGVAMGYFGGKGLPFFGLHIPGKAEPIGAIAKTAYVNHKRVGQVLEYALLPAHIAGAGFHAVRGQKIFARINPFK
jgi:cytochrome b561